MRTALDSIRDRCRSVLESADAATRGLEQEWRLGEPSLERYWTRLGPSATVSTLAALVKADLNCRFARGQRPSVADYLERFPALRGHDDRVLSLIYEEFCLLEEGGDHPEPEDFCARYARWGDSLASQLRYHRLLSQVVGPQAPPPRFPEPGAYFEEFRLDSLLGQGGAARVYLASDESLAGRKVALKVSLDRGQEPAILGRLDHAHIVPVHSVVFQPETQLRGLCMPYRPGLPLDEVVRRLGHGPRPRDASALRAVVDSADPSAPEGDTAGRSGWKSFPTRGTYPEAVAWIVEALARALAYAHSRGIIHRDVKPANVLLTLRDGPQLLDFNLAHDPHSPGQAEVALRGGTLPYMAPEQLEAFLDPDCWDRVGAAADLYAVGLLLRELLSGEPPEAPDPSLPLPRAIRALLDVRAARRDAPQVVDSNVPRALDAITARCLAFDPSARYPDALALAEDLRRFLDHAPLLHAKNPSARERAANWVRRNARGLAAAAVLIPLAVAGSYRPIVRTLVPTERLEAFRQAARLVDDHRERDAIRPLEGLVEEAPGSPLARFYLGVALLGRGDRDGASRQFAEMLAIPGASPAIVAWGRTDPATVGHLESLGNTLLLDKLHPLAENAFRMALEIDPTRQDARAGMALTLEAGEKYPRSHDLLSSLIREAESRRTREDRDRLGTWYRDRARVALRWAEERRRFYPKEASDEARARFLEAIEDLDRARTFFPPIDRERTFATNCTRAEILIALARLNLWCVRHHEALGNLREAKQVLDALDPQGQDQRNEQIKLSQKLSACEARAGKAVTTIAGVPPPAHSDAH